MKHGPHRFGFRVTTFCETLKNFCNIQCSVFAAQNVQLQALQRQIIQRPGSAQRTGTAGVHVQAVSGCQRRLVIADADTGNVCGEKKRVDMHFTQHHRSSKQRLKGAGCVMPDCPGRQEKSKRSIECTQHGKREDDVLQRLAGKNRVPTRIRFLSQCQSSAFDCQTFLG
ncbi:MAG: hypothetical protein ABI642_07000 [Polaromonas sp.]